MTRESIAPTDWRFEIGKFLNNFHQCERSVKRMWATGTCSFRSVSRRLSETIPMQFQSWMAVCNRILLLAVVTAVAYPVSFGPAFWLFRAGCVPEFVLQFYEPLGWGIAVMPMPASDALLWYAFYWD